MGGPLLYFLLVLVMMIWGFNVIAIKVIVTSFTPVTITALRILTAFLAVLPLMYYRKVFRALKKKEIFHVLGVAIFGITTYHYFLSVGLKYTTAANGGLILGAVPIATTLVAALFLGERLTVTRVIGLVLGFFGVAAIMLAGTAGSLSISFGDFYLCLAVLVQAFSFIFIRKASATVDTALITGFSQMFGGISLLILSTFIEPGGIPALTNGTMVAWLVFFASAIIATAFGHLLYNYAIQQIGAGKSAIFLNLSPFFSVIGAYLFLGEEIVTAQWFGFILIVIGVALGTGNIKQGRFKNRKGKAAQERTVTNMKS